MQLVYLILKTNFKPLLRASAFLESNFLTVMSGLHFRLLQSTTLDQIIKTRLQVLKNKDFGLQQGNKNLNSHAFKTVKKYPDIFIDLAVWYRH